jgi:hypothetical protein
MTLIVAFTNAVLYFNFYESIHILPWKEEAQSKKQPRDL